MQSKTEPLRSLQDVNDMLMSKLYDQISATDEVSTIVALSGAVAKLNASAKGSAFFKEPTTEEELVNADQLSALQALSGEIVVDSNE